MNYKKITKEQELEVLESRIRDLEMQHRVTTVNLIAAKAVADATDDDSTQHDTSVREVEGLEHNLETIEAALVALHAHEKSEIPNRAERRARKAAEKKGAPAA